MSPARANRESVLAVIREAEDELRRSRHVDDETIRRAIASACDTKGISPQDYALALEGDPALARLEHDAINDAIGGAVDPGPYASVSRESMSGKPGDTTKSRTNPEPPPHSR